MSVNIGTYFVPLDKQNVPKLLKVLENSLPDSVVLYNWLLVHSRWAEKISELKVTILCPGGEWTHGIAVALADGLAENSKIYATIYAPENGHNTLKDCLLETNLIDWERMKHFSGVLPRFVPILADVLKEKSCKHTDDFQYSGFLNYMPQTEAANQTLPELPPNVRVGPLDGGHLDIVCDNWRHYDPEYRPVAQKMLEINPSFGVFVRNKRGKEELASMVVQSEYGGVGLLQTVPEHRRKGYASIALAHLTRTLGRNGLMPHAHILHWNKQTSVLFHKLGYKVHAGSHWVICTKLNNI